ncbi:MAG: flagellar biosynthetic protein FliR [Bryobacteraceae bacterium]
MPIKVHFGLDALFGFLLTLTRVGSALVLFPIPGFRESPQTARIVLIAATTICLFPVWPAVHLQEMAGGQFLWAILGETATGVILGLAMSLLAESFQVAAQTISMQTGFGFASTVDPSSQADSTVFQALTQLATGLMFFAFGIHHYLLKLFAASFDLFNPSKVGIADATAGTIASLGASMLVTGLKMGLPVMTLLLLIDLALAMLSRMQSHLQLLSLAFPVKIGLSYLFIAALMVRWPGIYERAAIGMLNELTRLFSP